MRGYDADCRGLYALMKSRDGLCVLKGTSFKMKGRAETSLPCAHGKALVFVPSAGARVLDFEGAGDAYR
jgi:hypothetical protein